MTRFNNTEEVLAAAECAAENDYNRHLIVHTDLDGTTWQIDLNPYSTSGARGCWKRGFDGVPALPWGLDLRWDFQYQRGAAAARIVDKIRK